MCGGSTWSDMYQNIVKEIKKKGMPPEETIESIKTKWNHLAISKERLL